MQVDYGTIDGAYNALPLMTILTDDYGRLAAITISEWWDPMSGWYEYIVSDDTMHYVWRSRSDE